VRDAVKIGICKSAMTPWPTALEVLLFELAEVEQGRRSALLEPWYANLGVNAANHLRTGLKAEAAALLQVLRESGLSLNKAAREVADLLARSGFHAPSKRAKERYSAETIKDWRKEARKRKPPFFEMYDGALKAMREELQRLRDAGRDANMSLLKDSGERFTAMSYRG